MGRNFFNIKTFSKFLYFINIFCFEVTFPFKIFSSSSFVKSFIGTTSIFYLGYLRFRADGRQSFISTPYFLTSFVALYNYTYASVSVNFFSIFFLYLSRQSTMISVIEVPCDAAECFKKSHKSCGILMLKCLTSTCSLLMISHPFI